MIPTFQQAKDKASNEWNYDTWNDLIQHYIIDTKSKQDFYESIENRFDEAADIFVASKDSEIQKLDERWRIISTQNDIAEIEIDKLKADNERLTEEVRKANELLKRTAEYLICDDYDKEIKYGYKILEFLNDKK